MPHAAVFVVRVFAVDCLAHDRLETFGQVIGGVGRPAPSPKPSIRSVDQLASYIAGDTRLVHTQAGAVVQMIAVEPIEQVLDTGRDQ